MLRIDLGWFWGFCFCFFLQFSWSTLCMFFWRSPLRSRNVAWSKALEPRLARPAPRALRKLWALGGFHFHRGIPKMAGVFLIRKYHGWFSVPQLPQFQETPKIFKRMKGKRRRKEWKRIGIGVIVTVVVVSFFLSLWYQIGIFWRPSADQLARWWWRSFGQWGGVPRSQDPVHCSTESGFQLSEPMTFWVVGGVKHGWIIFQFHIWIYMG